MPTVHIPKEVYVRLQGGPIGSIHGVLYGESWIGGQSMVLVKVLCHTTQQLSAGAQGFLTSPGAQYTEVATALLDHLEAAPEATLTLQQPRWAHSW